MRLKTGVSTNHRINYASLAHTMEVPLEELEGDMDELEGWLFRSDSVIVDDEYGAR